MINGLADPIRDMFLGLDAPVRLEDGRMVPAINLDNAATTPALKQVAREIERQLMYYGSIGRGKGQKSAHSSQVYTAGRDAVKRFVGAASDKYQVFYAGCTTDGMNKLASALIESPNDVVLATRMEHHANDLPWRERARTVYAEVDEQGRLKMDDFDRLLNAHAGAVKVVTVAAASNVTGYVNDVHAIAKVAHRYGAKMVVDGAQIAAHRKFRMLGCAPDEDIDFFVFSAHKMYAPYGGGAVVGLKDVLDSRLPKFYGGGMVEGVCDESVCYSPAPDRYEAGSPNYPGVVGMLKAIETLECVGFEGIEAHEQRLMRRALDGLKCIPGAILYGDSENIRDRVGIVAFNLRGIDCGVVADQLAARSAIAVRHAAFCAHPYVRRLTKERETQPCAAPKGMVRVSFGLYSGEEDVDCLLATLREIVRCTHAASASPPKNDLPNDRG